MLLAGVIGAMYGISCTYRAMTVWWFLHKLLFWEQSIFGYQHMILPRGVGRDTVRFLEWLRGELMEAGDVHGIDSTSTASALESGTNSDAPLVSNYKHAGD